MSRLHKPIPVRPLLFAAGAVLLAGCGKKPEPGAAPVPSPPPAVQARPSAVPLEDIGMVHKEVPARLEDHAWDTEHLNDAAGQQLKALGKWLVLQTAQSDQTELPAVFSPALQSTPLRPESTTVLTQPPLTVQRMAGASAQPQSVDAAAFAGQLRPLLTAVPQPVEITTNFKIFRVTADPPETTARVELVARSASRSMQQIAHWRCRWEKRADGDPLLASVIVESFEETVTDTARTFTDCTGTLLGGDKAFSEHLAHSLDHWVARMEQQYVFGPSGWEGFAMGDANGDGRQDLYVCQPGGLPNRLLVQNADGTLSDRAGESGVDFWDQTQAALFCDWDNDGDQDLALAMIWGVLFLANDGSGKFQPAASKLSPEGMSYSLAAADFDADGDLDLYVCCYGKRSSGVEHRFLARPLPYHDANNGSRNMLLRNDRSWRWRDVTKSVGLHENNQRFSFAVAWEDYDSDGDLDLYVANDFGRNNLYRCDRTADSLTFKDVAAEAGVEDISAGMSASWGDADNDGRPDLYVSNMWSSAGNRVAYQRRFREGSGGLAAFQRHARGNSLFQNTGDGTFRDVSEPSGVTMGRWAWGSRFADLNNDGWDDLVVANGYITQPDAADL